MVERNLYTLILTIVIVCVAFTHSNDSIPQSSVNASNDEPVSSDTQGTNGVATNGGGNDKNESEIRKEKKEKEEEVPPTLTEETMIENSTDAKELVTTETEETMPLDNSLDPEKKEELKYNEERKEEEGGIEGREVDIETVGSTKEREGGKKVENTSITLSGQDKETSSGQDEVTNSSSEDHTSSINDTEASEPDDIVTFEEFKNRASQELNQPIKQPQGIIHKGNSNNFASHECGAKVVATNPEAKNSHAILTGNKDEYMLNPCSADVWFVIELCELVSVNKFEIGSFELFSSIPESFAVFTSESYPTSKWESISSFQMRNERGIQEFPFADTVYAKYIKIVMLSHFGSEHYCPISMVSVYGTTMMEEYELSETQRTQGEKRDSREDEGKITITDTDNTDSTIKSSGPEAHNPLLAATGAIISVIGKAVNGLMGKEEDEGRINNIDSDDKRQLSKSTEPGDLHQVSSDKAQSGVIGPSVEEEGKDMDQQLSNERDSQELSSDPPARDTSADVPVITEVTLVASTNVLESTLRDDALVVPDSSSSDTLLGPTDELSSLSSSSSSLITSSNSHSSDPEVPIPSTSSSTLITPLDSSSVHSSSSEDTLTLSEEILITSSSFLPLSLEQKSLKTVTPVHLTSTPIDPPSEGPDPVESTPVPLPIETPLNVQNITQDDSESDSRSIINNDTLLLNNGTDNASMNAVLHNTTNPNARNVTNNSSILNVSNATDPANPVDEGNNVNFSSGSHREKSVFLRLSNRINNLEMNMSLFGSYLDQISSSLRRSKNRTDDMQKSLERRMSYLNTTIQSQVQLNMSLVSDLFVSVDHLTLLLMEDLHHERKNNDNFEKIEIVLLAVLGLGIVQTLILCCIIAVLLRYSSTQSSLNMSIQSLRSDLASFKNRLRGEEEEEGVTKIHKKGGEREKADERHAITKSSSHESFDNRKETVTTLDSSSLPSISRGTTGDRDEWHTVSHTKKKRKHLMSFIKQEPPITQK